MNFNLINAITFAELIFGKEKGVVNFLVDWFLEIQYSMSIYQYRFIYLKGQFLKSNESMSYHVQLFTDDLNDIF